jgi:hypothetical protein
MRFVFEVEVEVERDEGKFASRDELAEQIESALTDADPGTLDGDAGGSYSTSSWSVAEIDQKGKK